jgi:formylglycine-generating enzyme required for sulfatase activity
LAELPQGGFNVNEYKTMKLALRRIEPGSFKMCGLYDVTLAKPFYMGIFEVTQKQYELVHGSNPSALQGDMRPVECVSWNTIRGDSSTYDWPNSTSVDPSTFVGRIQSRTGLKLDLPTEAQWEYACRAGSTTALPNGPIVIKGKYNAPALDPIAWYGGNSSQGFTGQSAWNSSGWPETQYPGGPCGVHAVGKKGANAWGLYDMIGNVLEWCSDYYDADYYDRSPTSDPENTVASSARVNRGGGWGSSAEYCRSAHRYWSEPESRSYGLGLRVLLVPSPAE